MGNFLSIARLKRRRGGDSDGEYEDAIEADAADTSSALARLLRSLRYSCADPGVVGTAVCRSVADDETTRQTYGCHAHVYETATPDESHGVALAWCLDAAAPMSTLSLLSLCRVANSCRKAALVTTKTGQAILLTYTATL